MPAITPVELFRVRPDGTVVVNGKPLTATKKSFDEAAKKLQEGTDKHLTKEEAKEVNKDIKEELTQDDINRMEREIVDKLKKGILDNPMSSRTYGGGDSAGAARQMVRRIVPPDKVNWKGIINAYLQFANGSNYSWSKLARQIGRAHV